MSKRGPTSELNHDNWDKEDADKESAGEFKQADTDEIKKRVILSAKRKSTSSSGSDAAVNVNLNAWNIRFFNTLFGFRKLHLATSKDFLLLQQTNLISASLWTQSSHQSPTPMALSSLRRGTNHHLNTFISSKA